MWLVLIPVVILIALLVYWFVFRNPPAPATTGPMCSFEGEDLFNKNVYLNGTLVTTSDQVPCSNCNQYVFRDADGCIPMGYDDVLNEPVCQVGFRNTLGNWSVPLPKKCQ